MAKHTTPMHSIFIIITSWAIFIQQKKVNMIVILNVLPVEYALYLRMEHYWNKIQLVEINN
ncbi:hypothetical protein yinte0001_27110 [Yersinia intermedia ATCC 29909]|nr:hypothetical protein yinte0001_27110 [Yersinia intermedia ATCC 29909]